MRIISLYAATICAVFAVLAFFVFHEPGFGVCVSVLGLLFGIATLMKDGVLRKALIRFVAWWDEF